MAISLGVYEPIFRQTHLWIGAWSKWFSNTTTAMERVIVCYITVRYLFFRCLQDFRTCNSFPWIPNSLKNGLSEWIQYSGFPEKVHIEHSWILEGNRGWTSPVDPSEGGGISWDIHGAYRRNLWTLSSGFFQKYGIPMYTPTWQCYLKNQIWFLG